MDRWERLWIDGNNRGEGYHVGPYDVDPPLSPEDAAQAEGWEILDRGEEGSILCRATDSRGERIVAICDSHGPWAVDLTEPSGR